MVSAARRAEVIDTLRRGTVPRAGLDLFAVGMERFERAIEEELDGVEAGRAVFKAVRGEYGTGKTFFARWLAERAKRRGMAAAEIQISETETPLHKLETVYRRLVEQLSTAAYPPSALREIVDAWFYTLEEDVLAEGVIEADNSNKLAEAVDALMERRLAEVARTTPAFASALRAYRNATLSDDQATAQSLIAWIGGQPNVSAAARRAAGVKGDLDHFAALGFLQGLLTILRDSGHPGLLVVLDEIETLQRVRSDVRDKGLNALRQLIDDVDSGRFPGLYLLITGTPAFYDGPQGVTRLTPLAQRLATDFGTDPRFDSPRAVQIRLTGFDLPKLAKLGIAIRDVYAAGQERVDLITARVDDSYIEELARAVAGDLGGQVGIAPRIFLRKLVADVLDRVAEFDEFDPRQHYKLTLSKAELTDTERNAAAFQAQSADDVELDL
ncbi:MAG: BREX system ATP-binding protein BrxD [Nocardiopsaceae bacterium]|nr:BREX system ATP-binding protein BrxD [Nocardiopsaceae bacterium]